MYIYREGEKGMDIYVSMCAILGTVPYMACEMVRGEPYGHAVDV